MDETSTRRWPADAAALAGYLAGAVVLCGRLLAHPGRRLPYTPGDRMLGEYFLAWVARCVRHGSNPFVLDRLNAPAGVNGMANVTAVGLGLPMSPVTLLFGPGVAFDVLMVLTVAATGATWYWLLSRHLVQRRAAAWTGGLVAAFAPSVANHASFHVHLTAQFLVPLIVWRVIRLRDAPVRGGLILGALVVWQVFIAEETLLITALAAGLAGLLWLVQRPAEVRLPNVLAGLGVTLLATSLVLAYPLWWQFAGTGSYRGGDQQMTQFHTDLLGFTSFSRNSVAVRSSEFQPPPGWIAEQHAYFGWPLVIAVVAVVVWRWREPVVRCLALTGGVFAALSLGNHLTVSGHDIGVPGPYLPLSHLPLFDMLLPTRLGEAATWAVAPLVAIGLDRLPAPAGYRVLKAGLVAAVLLPAAPVPFNVLARPAVPSFIASGEWRSYVRAEESVLVVPLASFEHWTAMSWASATGCDLRLSHGYFFGPDGGVSGSRGIVGPPARPTDLLISAATSTHQVTAVTDIDREQARLDLAYWRTSIVLAPPGEATAAERGTLEALLGPGRQVGGLWLWDVRKR